MKKNTIFNAIVITAILVLAFFQFVRNDKVVYIDTNVLMNEYKGMQVMKAEYQEKAAVWQSNIDTLITDWETELRSYEKERKSMTAKERQLKEELLGNRQQQINQYREAMGAKAREEEQKMTQTVLNEVNDYIKEYGKKHGYKYILGATGAGNLVYAKEAYNITEDVMVGLNKEYVKTH